MTINVGLRSAGKAKLRALIVASLLMIALSSAALAQRPSGRMEPEDMSGADA